MRSLALLAGLYAAASSAQEAPATYEIFVDRNETYVRAGTAQGLEQGSSVTVWGDLIATTKERRRAGTATVMEIWPSLARVNLDEAARADKAAKKYASFEPRKRVQVPTVLTAPPPPPTAAPAPASKDAGRAPLKDPDAKPANPNAAPVLKGHATFKGAGPFMVLSLFNDEAFDWNTCNLSLPGGLVYTLPHLRAGDRESIALSNFVQQGPEREAIRDSVTVRCKQGASRFLFPID